MEWSIDYIITFCARGVLMSMMYLNFTLADDFNLINVVKYTLFYVATVIGAEFAGIDSIIVTNAFMTKTIFTLVEDRVKKTDTENKVI